MRLFLIWIQQWSETQRVQQITHEAARRRVTRGAVYLDDVDPGWWQRLDMAELELSHGQSCVLGQLHGGFERGLARSAIWNMGSAPRASLSPVSLGFLCVQGVSEEWQERDYALLNAAWQEEIIHRRPPVDIEQLIGQRTEPLQPELTWGVKQEASSE